MIEDTNVEHISLIESMNKRIASFLEQQEDFKKTI